MPRKASTHEEPGSMLEQLGWSRQAALAKDDRPVQELVPILSLEEIKATLSSKRETSLLNSSFDLSDVLGLDSSSKFKMRRKSRPLSGISNASSRPGTASANDVAKAAMKSQEPQLLDKMENVAYRMASQADKRKKHMNSRGVFDDEQNALRARSIQRVQLWKGLQPSALSEAVSHFAKSQHVLRGHSSLSRSGTLQSRMEKACLDIVNRLDADIPLAAIQGTLDKHTSGKLAPGKLDTAMAAITTEFAATAKVKAQQLEVEQQPSMKKMAAEVVEAERLQQSEETMYSERQTRLSLAESNLRQLVARMEEEEAQTAQHSRLEEGHLLTASGPPLLQAILARLKGAEDRQAATRAPKVKAVIQRAVTVEKVRQIATHGHSLSPRTSGLSSTLRRGQSVSAAQSSKVDYELGKTYGQLDADRYYGGLHSYRTQSGHAAFSGSPTKPWESGQRPRSLQPEEMPWARGHSPSSPPKSLSDRTTSVATGQDAYDLLDGMPRQHQQSSTLALEATASDVTAQPSSDHIATSQLFEMSILDQDSSGVVSLPSRVEVEAIPMPQLPNLEGSDKYGHFKSIAQFLQVRLERVWGILQMPVTAKLDWVIRYTGQEAGGLFEPALQAWEQAAAAVLERERLLLQLSEIQQQHLQQSLLPSSSWLPGQNSASGQVGRLAIAFVVATAQVEAAAKLLQDVFDDTLLYQGVAYPGKHALTIRQLEQFVARVCTLSTG